MTESLKALYKGGGRCGTVPLLHGEEEMSPIFFHVQRTVCCHQGKRSGEEQVHVPILMIRAEREASVSQVRSLTPTDIHVCFDIICALLLLCR